VFAQIFELALQDSNVGEFAERLGSAFSGRSGERTALVI